jgi:hypothetical protein
MAQWFGYWTSFVGAIVNWVFSNIGTLVSTFFGAYFAFLFERRKRYSEQAEKNIDALNRALFTLTVMWDTLRQYQRDYLNPMRERPDRWLNLTSHPLAAQHEGIQFEPGQLYFLLTKKGTCFANVMLQERRFKLAVGMIQHRTQVMLNEAFPRLRNVPKNSLMSEAEAERLLGIGITQQLKQFTDQIYEFVDEDLPSIEATFNELRAAAKDLYPKGKFIGNDFNAPPFAPKARPSQDLAR